jgi:hypothetical protein
VLVRQFCHSERQDILGTSIFLVTAPSFGAHKHSLFMSMSQRMVLNFKFNDVLVDIFGIFMELHR